MTISHMLVQIKYWNNCHDRYQLIENSKYFTNILLYHHSQ